MTTELSDSVPYLFLGLRGGSRRNAERGKGEPRSLGGFFTSASVPQLRPLPYIVPWELTSMNYIPQALALCFLVGLANGRH